MSSDMYSLVQYREPSIDITLYIICSFVLLLFQLLCYSTHVDELNSHFNKMNKQIEQLVLEEDKDFGVLLKLITANEDRIKGLEENQQALLETVEKIDRSQEKIVKSLPSLFREKDIEPRGKPDYKQKILSYLRSSPAQDVRNIRAHLMDSDPLISRYDVNTALYMLLGQGKVIKNFENGNFWSLA